MDQKILNNYFNNTWRHLKNSELNFHELSGAKLVDRILPGESVIDVGCGKNHFKNLIPNLLGIDPAFPEADVHMSIEEYAPVADRKFDVAFCLGSINFGSKENIENQIKLVVGLLKPTSRIYWRTNPGRKDHGVKECEDIDFYPWSVEEHIRLSNMFGFELKELSVERSTNRLFSVWVRL